MKTCTTHAGEHFYEFKSNAATDCTDKVVYRCTFCVVKMMAKLLCCTALFSNLNVLTKEEYNNSMLRSLVHNSGGENRMVKMQGVREIVGWGDNNCKHLQ